MVQDFIANYSSPQFLHNFGADNIAYLITYQVSNIVSATAGGVSITFTWDDGTGAPIVNNAAYGMSGGPPLDVFFICVMVPGSDLDLDFTMVGSADGTYRVALTYTQIV